MYFNDRGIALVAAIALPVCFAPALAQQAGKSNGSENPASAAVADKFRMPLGNGNLTENDGDSDGWYVSKGFGDPFGRVCSTAKLPICYHVGENWNFGGQELGKPVYAVANGEILDFGYSSAPRGRLPGSLGNYVLIKHSLPAPGRYIAHFGRVNTVVSLYGHLLDLKGICGSNSVSCKVGQPVKIGALIGHVGMTGADASGGANLHFEIRLTTEKCLNSPKQIAPNASCLGYSKIRYPLHYANGGGWVDPTCFIKNQTAPKNDDFASATSVHVGMPMRGSSLCATREQDEPNHAGKIIDTHGLNAAGKSVWWKFTAPKSARYTVSTIGSDFDTVLGVYTYHSGTSLRDLEPVAKHNDSENPRLCTSAKFCTSKVTFTASAGATYFIAVDGHSTDAIAAASGTIRLTVTETGPNLVVTASSSFLGPGYEGGPFASPTIKFSLSASQGTLVYSISNVPPWLTASSTFGMASQSPKLVNFTLNSKANALAAGTHPVMIVFGSSSSQGPQTRIVQLLVKTPPALQVTPSGDITASGNQGGPFSPTSFSYQIKATRESVKYSISGVPSWITVSSASGTATTTPKIVTFTVNSAAKTLAAGTYNGSITVTALPTGQGQMALAAAQSYTRKIKLTVNAGALQISPSSGINASGNQGGPFSPSSFDYSLSSTSGSVNYSITGVPTWLTVSSPSGTLTTTPKTVTFAVNANANSLAAGTYNATITVTNSTNAKGTTTISAALTANGALQVTPKGDVGISGNQGGPFSPPAFSFSLSSTGGSVNYSITGVPDWLTVSSASGTATTAAKTVTFTVNSNASSLAAGSYSTNITFTNTTNGKGTASRLAVLTVNAAPPPPNDFLTDDAGAYLLDAIGGRLAGL